MRMCVLLLAAGASAAVAADKPAPAAQAASIRVQIAATLMADRDAIKKELGLDLGDSFIVVKVELTPRGDEPLAVSRDDFLLRSYKDGQKSGPFAPSQIAGRAALVVSTRSLGGGIGGDPGGPVWGGIPGTGGRPQQLPGQGGSMGNAAGGSEAQATLNSGTGQKEDPLLKVLSEKILPEKEGKEPLSGLLYFSLEGKHKPKDLTLQYNGPAGKLNLPFH